MTKTVKMKLRKPPKTLLSRTKARYRFQPGFANEVKKRSRKIYRKEKGKDFELMGKVVLRSLDTLDLEAETKAVINQITSETEVFPVIGLTHVAKLLNITYQTIWRWTSETRQLPMPVLIDTSTGREYGVYHLEEVRVIVSTIGEHLCDFKYFRKDHEQVTRSLLHQIDALRARNFNTETTKDKHNGSPNSRKKARRKTISRRKVG